MILNGHHRHFLRYLRDKNCTLQIYRQLQIVVGASQKRTEGVTSRVPEGHRVMIAVCGVPTLHIYISYFGGPKMELALEFRY